MSAVQISLHHYHQVHRYTQETEVNLALLVSFV